MSGESSTHMYIVRVASGVSLLAGVIAYVLFQQRKAREVKRLLKRRRKEESTVNIGAIFGMDVGGTLTKIVYFESTKDLQQSGVNGFSSSDLLQVVGDVELEQAQKAMHKSTSAAAVGASCSADDASSSSSSSNLGPLLKITSMPSKLDMARRGSSESLAQLDQPDHQHALQKFYNFMEENHSAGASSGVIRDYHLMAESEFLEGRLHFLHFETRNMVAAIHFMSDAALIDDIRSIGCTGGGAHKYAKEFEEQLGITFNKYDELQCLIRGMHFALTNFDDECFTYRPAPPVGKQYRRSSKAGAATASAAGTATTDAAAAADAASEWRAAHGEQQASHAVAEEITEDDEDSEAKEREASQWRKEVKDLTEKVIIPLEDMRSMSTFPYLVVNIGSGVSILKVTSPGKATRISGTSIGGGTYWGLCRLLTRCATYEEVLDIAERGDAGKVDMLVKDIYGGDYGEMLRGSMVASSFGKLVMKEDPHDEVREEDLALALLMMITNNIGQVAYLNAQLHSCSKIFFVGSFLRHNTISCRRLAFAIQFWSSGAMEAYFLTHEGHFGALGTFLESAFGSDVDKVLSAGQSFHQPAAERTPLGEESNGQTEAETNSSAEKEDASEPWHLTLHLSEEAAGKNAANRRRAQSSFLGGSGGGGGGSGGGSEKWHSLSRSHSSSSQQRASLSSGSIADPGALANSGAFFKPNEGSGSSSSHAQDADSILRTTERSAHSKRGRSSSDDHLRILRERMRLQSPVDDSSSPSRDSKSTPSAEEDAAPEF